MTQEEKAKRYDEAIERAKKWYDANTNEGYRGIFEDIFPELKESEDERIRKELIDFVKSRLAGFPDCKRFTDWLEKQGNNNMGISEATKKKLEDNLNMALEKETPESLNKFLDEQKPTDKKRMNLVEEKMTPFQKKVFCIIDTAIEEEQGLKHVCDELFALASNEIKQKSAWSEEDEANLKGILDCYKSMDTKWRNWLKSLKSQNKWKPSDEQMKALSAMKRYCEIATSFDAYKQEIVESLYQDLKKLREG